jgi:hypothetical protein
VRGLELANVAFQNDLPVSVGEPRRGVEVCARRTSPETFS